jgi:hypothetical protein
MKTKINGPCAVHGSVQVHSGTVVEPERLQAGAQFLIYDDQTVSVVVNPETCMASPIPCNVVFFNEEIGYRAGYVPGDCGHAVAGMEWRAGLRNCERC